MKTLSKSSMIKLLRHRIAQAGTQTAFAAKHKVTVSYLQMILSGDREFGPKILRALRAKRLEPTFEVQDDD